MEPCAVLHIASLHGGGVDRHVRDIVRGVARRQWIWHAGDTAEVLESPRERRYLALDPAAVEREGAIVARWLAAQRVGVLHAHSVGGAARRRALGCAAALGLPTIVTLHDVLFLRPDALDPGVPVEPDPAWLAQTSAFLRSAAAVLAPSDYIAGLARQYVPGLEVGVVPNGSAPAAGTPGTLEPRPEFGARRPEHVAAVLGAIGPHKGSRVLEELDGLLAGTGIAIVVIGYLDAQVPPGWRGEHLFIHGPCQDEELAPLLRAYGARLALFPNRAPESFSYALSDAWSAGLPALVPAEGALAERVRCHGGGWILPAGAGAREIAAALVERLGARGAAELARVESDLQRPDDSRVPRADRMSRSLEALYARYGIDADAPLDARSPDLQALLARNLDGALFREELARLADELVQLREGLEAERARFEREARPWIAKLEADVAALQSQLAAQVESRRALGDENFELRNRNAMLERYKAAFDRLPAIVRRIALKILHARG